MRKKEWLIFLFFLSLVCFLRFSTFFQSLIDVDESLYLLMSQSILNGQVPYVAVWDQKPPGIYILFSLAQLLLGHSVISIRILACIAITITCYLLYRLGNVISNNLPGIGLLAGITYAFLSLINGGLASNTEIFFTPFVVLAFYLLFLNGVHPAKPFNQSNLRLFIVGLIIGLAIQIKPLVVFDFTAILIIVIVDSYFKAANSRDHFLKTILKSCTLLIIGAILPFFFVATYFVLTGHFADYVYANFTANKIYSVDNPFSFNLFSQALKIQFRTSTVLWLCAFSTPVYLVLDKHTNSEEKKKLWLILLWLLTALIATCFTKRFYTHYFLQLLPPLCILSSYLLIAVTYREEKRFALKKYIVLFLLLFPLFKETATPPLRMGKKFIKFRYIERKKNWNDTPAIAANYLKERINKQDYIYVIGYDPILYYLVPAQIPTKYVFSKWLTNKGFSHYSGSNPIEELNLILKKKPIYIIKEAVKNPENDNDSFYTALDNYMKKYYTFETSIDDLKLYKLKGHNP